MRVFLSYADEHTTTAEGIYLRLVQAGHKVFYDKSKLHAGLSFDDPIRKSLKGSDLLVFLISPESVTQGSYALTEMAFWRERWEVPSGRVLPVMVAPTPYDSIPPYLRSVAVFKPQGDVVAETAREVERLKVPKVPNEKRTKTHESALRVVLFGVSAYAAFVLAILGPCVVVVYSLGIGEENEFTTVARSLGLVPLFKAVMGLGIRPWAYLVGLFGAAGAVVSIVRRFERIASQPAPFWLLFGQGLFIPILGSLSAVIACRAIHAMDWFNAHQALDTFVAFTAGLSVAKFVEPKGTAWSRGAAPPVANEP